MPIPTVIWHVIACALGVGGAGFFYFLGNTFNDERRTRTEDRLFAQPLLHGVGGLFVGGAVPSLLQAVLPVLDTPAWDAWVVPALFALSALVSLCLLLVARYQQEASVLCLLAFLQFLVAEIASGVNVFHMLPPVNSAMSIHAFLAACGLVACLTYYPLCFLHARLSRALRLPSSSGQPCGKGVVPPVGDAPGKDQPSSGKRPGKEVVLATAAIEVLLLASLAVSRHLGELLTALPLAAGVLAGLLGPVAAVLLLGGLYHSKPPYPIDHPVTQAEDEEPS